MGNLSMWNEGILLTLAFISCLSIVIVGLNGMYNKDYSLGLSDNNTESLFITYQESAQENIRGGEVTFDSTNGISLKSGYDLVVDAVEAIWNFITGGFIETLASYFNLGAPMMLLAKALRIIWFLSLVFGIIYLVWKVEP